MKPNETEWNQKSKLKKIPNDSQKSLQWIDANWWLFSLKYSQSFISSINNEEWEKENFLDQNIFV